MREFLLFIASIFILGCSEVLVDTITNPNLSPDEAKVVTIHLMGKSVTQEEAISDALSVMSELDKASGITRSTTRTVEEVITAKGSKMFSKLLDD